MKTKKRAMEGNIESFICIWFEMAVKYLSWYLSGYRSVNLEERFELWMYIWRSSGSRCLFKAIEMDMNT